MRPARRSDQSSRHLLRAPAATLLSIGLAVSLSIAGAGAPGSAEARTTRRAETAAPPPPQPEPVRPPRTDLPSILIDRGSGTVLAAHRPFEAWHPASLTKLMTLYVTLEAIRAGEIEPGSPVTISERAAKMPPSRVGWGAGARLRVDAALRLLVVKSANDVAVALAESVAGSTDAFVARMNETAARLGMTGSAFRNPNGLHDAGQFVTARDMALLSRRLLVDFPETAALFTAPALRMTTRGRKGPVVKTEESYNLLLGRFLGADGMKTGFVCASGYNMVASATREGRQLIAVVLGAESQTERAVAAAGLLVRGFAAEVTRDEAAGGEPAVEAPVAVAGADTAVEPAPAVEAFTPDPAQTREPPRSQAGTLCAPEAVAARYEPGAGQAVIRSPLLQDAVPVAAPLDVAPGGIDGPIALALRPQPALDLEGRPTEPVAADAPLGLRAGIPIPLRRPDMSPALRGAGEARTQ